MSEQYKITEEQKKLLLQISAQTLPDNPSRDGYSAEQIRGRLYKPYAALIDLINGVFGTAYSDVSEIQETIENGDFFARSFVQWSATYTYGANEITYYPVGTYGALVKSLVANNTNNEPYTTGGVPNSAFWEEVLNFDGALSEAQGYAASAATSATDAYNYQLSAKGFAEAAESSANSAASSENNASGSAFSANQFKEAAESSATAAAGSATAAANSATEAQGYAQQAKDYAQKHYAVYPSFDALPVPGDSAFIYLVPAEDGEENNSYTEYLWITDLSSYESIGTVNDIDLSGYAQINGTYAGMTVGNATNAQTAQNAQQLGGVAASQYAKVDGTYSGMVVGYAYGAGNDSNGNNIADTYATKAEVAEVQADVDASVVDLGTLVVGNNTISSDLVQAALNERCTSIKFTFENMIVYLPKATTASSAEAATFGFANYDSSLVSYMVGISGTTAIVSYNEIDVATEAQVNAKYTKPSTGIPKTDLASAVQTSLGKADTALQSVPLATSSAIGGVKPVAKTDDMTQSVGVDASGALFTAPSGGTIEYMTNEEVDALFASTPSIPSFADATWEQIAQVAEAGTASDYFVVGDEKTITLSTDEQVTLVILGFNHDDLSDSSGKAGITIGMKNLLATTYRMNASNTNAGGWDESEMRTSTMATLLSQLPSDLQSVIKQVNKKATAGSQSTSIITSADKLWLLAEVEVDGTTSAGYTDEGEQYEYWKTVKDGTVAGNRIKYLSNGSGSAYFWWMRSPYVSLATSFRNFNSTGGVSFITASSTRGVCFGFCV